MLIEQYVSIPERKIATMRKCVMVISVCSHSIDLELPAEKAAAQSKELVSIVGGPVFQYSSTKLMVSLSHH